MNMIVSFPYSDNQLVEWVYTIFRLYPDSHDRLPEIIGKITDDFLKGDYEFDKNIGIVNFTYRVKQYLGII